MDWSWQTKGIEEGFFHCKICSEYFREPKLLPCFHRFCKRCLETNMVQHRGVLTCPLCSRSHSVPVQGIHGFKTDYHLENLLEYKQIKFSLETKAIRDCVGCSTKLKIAAYCFKCKDFLCQKCLQFHLTNRMVADHQSKLLSAEEFETKGFDLQTYSLLKETPICFFHPDTPAHQCCVTCNNIALCSLCSSTNHKGHNLNEIKTLTTDEKSELNKIMADLEKCKQRFEGVVEAIAATSSTANTKATSSNLCQYQTEVRKIKERIVDTTEKMKKEKSSLNIEMGLEIKRVTEEYDKNIEAIENKVKRKTEALQQQHDSQVKGLNDRHDQLQNMIKKEGERVRQTNGKRANDLSQLKDDSTKLRDRIKDFNLTVTSIHAMGNDWTAAEYLPDIKTSYKDLVDEANNMFVRLKSLTKNSVNQPSPGVKTKVPCFGRPFLCKSSVVEITDMKHTTQKIHSVASCENDHFVITGYDSRNFSFLSLVDLKGKLVRTIKTSEKNVLPACFCATWSGSKVVTVSKANLIGIFDIRDSSYMQKDISSMLNWNPTWKLTCVDTHPIKNLVYVGGSNLKIYIFDDLLQYKYSLGLPETVKSVSHIVVLEGAIVVCDKTSKGVYMLAKQQGLLSIINKLQPPTLDGDDYCPLKVTADKQGFIFTLWSAKVSAQACRICAKYSKDGIKLLAAGKLDRLEEIITVMTTPDGGQKLIMSTGKSNKLFLYEWSTQDQTPQGIPNRSTGENQRMLQVTVQNGQRGVSLQTENQGKRGHSPSAETSKHHRTANQSPSSSRTVSSTSSNSNHTMSNLSVASTSTGSTFPLPENITQRYLHNTGPQNNQYSQFHPSRESDQVSLRGLLKQ